MSKSILRLNNNFTEEKLEEFRKLMNENKCELLSLPLETPLNKLFICKSKEEKETIVNSAENLLLQYTVQKHNENLWHVTVILE